MQEQHDDDVRVSDAEREAVIERCKTAAADGRLTLSELSDRIDAVYAARTFGELRPLASDLPGGQVVARDATPTATSWTVAVFGDEVRSGGWRVSGPQAAVSVFGDVTLDMAEARVEVQEVDVQVMSVFGDLEVVVPDGVEVDLRGFTLFGDKRLESTRAEWSHAAPRITVRGFTLFGDVRVRTA